MESKSELKQKLADALGVDSVNGLLWNYEPRNYKVGDKIICIDSMRNPYRNEEVVFGQEYTVGWYDKGNLYAKGLVQIEGCNVLWYDDRFELKKETEIIDIEHEDITNKKLLLN